MHVIHRSLSSRPGVRLAGLGLLIGLGACSTPETGFREALWSPFAGPTPVASDSLTVQRIRGGNPEVAPLASEPGNVWPEPETPRPTLLGGPEEAFRNIPEYRPTLVPANEPARSPVPTPGATPPRARGSSTGPAAPLPLAEQQRAPVAQPAFPPSPPAPRLEGRPLTDPSGRPGVSTGGTPRMEGFTTPGGAGGTVLRDGNVETWIGADGQTRTRVVPR